MDMPMTEQSEKILISLAKRGDMAAFEQLVLAHEKRVAAGLVTVGSQFLPCAGIVLPVFFF